MNPPRSLRINPLAESALPAAHRELIRTLLGDSLQPGIYGLLSHAGQVLDVQPQESVLFVALDPVAGALSLAREFACMVHAVALAPNSVERGQRRIAEAREEQRVTLEAGHPDRLDRFVERFDILITENVLATSADKFAAAEMIYAVLRSHGRLALTEPTVYHDLIPEELRPLFSWLAPLAGARPAPVYRNLLGESGLTAFVTEDRRQDLQRAVEAARQKLLLTNLSSANTQLNDNDELEASIRLARRVLDLISQGVASFVLISAEKP